MHPMRHFMRLTEGENIPLIVVDVQPAYRHAIHFPVPKLMQFVNQHAGEVLMFVNAEETGVSEDSKDTIAEYWLANGLDEDKLDNLQIVDKGYGYLRAWMDFVGERVIVDVARFMIKHRINDSREILDRTGHSLEEVMGDDYDEACETDPLIINFVDFKLLKRFGSGYLCGGGRDECLAEVRIMMDVLGLEYRLLDQFIY